MIALAIRAESDAERAFVTRLRRLRTDHPDESWCIVSTNLESVWCGSNGAFQLELPAAALEGDVVLVRPGDARADRLLRLGSPHNSLLVTERCDQLCIMCSQPPKKTHIDRFALLTQACLLAEPDITIGITGGEPTLFLEPLLTLIETVHRNRSDLRFHVLSNAQHFAAGHIERLRGAPYRQLTWGIPLYAADAAVHDRIVGKPGAFERLHESFDHLLLAGAQVELRTVLLSETLASLPALARHVTTYLAHVRQWSLMGLENIGFARNRWGQLYPDLRQCFDPVGEALDIATLFGVEARLFNVPLCHIPEAFRHLAVASISDWKQRFGARCEPCRERAACAGFFEWHPAPLLEEVTPL